MPRKRKYVLTPTARAQLREAKTWSLARWGPEQTAKYFQDLHDAAERLATNHRASRSRDELADDTGLLLHPVREHYFVYEPLAPDRIVIVAVIRQGRDIPAILNKGRHIISRELRALRNRTKQK